MIKYTQEQAIKPKYTTLVGKDGVIKGDELVFTAHEIIQNNIKQRQESFSYQDGKNEDNSYQVSHGDDWLVAAGHWAQDQADSEIKKFLFKNIVVGYSKLEVNLEKTGRSERLHLSKEFLEELNKIIHEFCVKHKKDKRSLKKTDLTCKEIFAITNILKVVYAKKETELAKLQLQRLRGKGQINIILDQWLDYFNAWLFGVEASRVNTTFVTGVMVLELIADKKMTYKEALAEGQFGGQLPAATIASVCAVRLFVPNPLFFKSQSASPAA